jgi:RNA polymerase sigma-70 factor (ECF subfamily)
MDENTRIPCMTRTPDDIRNELLVLRCRRQDAAAWNELVRLFQDRLFYFVRRFVRDDDQAAVVMQDLWIQVLRGLPFLRSSDRLTPWLYTIARRMVVNRYRRDASDPTTAAAEVSGVSAEDEHEPFEQFENAELVHFGLSRLDVAGREVLTLHFLEEFSVDEIAGILEIPGGTVKSRLFRARSELRRILDQESLPPSKGVRS